MEDRICEYCVIAGGTSGDHVAKVILLWNDGTWEKLAQYDRFNNTCLCPSAFKGKTERQIKERFETHPERYIRRK